jgi:hypothetical protein
MFSSIGVSVILAIFVVVGATGRAEMVEHVTPFNDVLRYFGYAGHYSMESARGLAIIAREIDKQAAMQAYNAVFMVLALGAMAAIPLVLVIGRAKPGSPARDREEFERSEPFMIAE